MGGPADIFATSGGAVNALALVAKHPEHVRTLVAHEPPAAQELPDREAVLAACRDIHQTYQRAGFGPAMAKFIALVSYQGPIPGDYAGRPAPDPATFGLPTDDDGTRDDPLAGQNMISCPGYRHDFSALRAASTRIVAGADVESGQAMTGRAAVAVAERLGTAPVTFPGGHDGFPGGEYGGSGQPEAFAATLRRVLTGWQHQRAPCARPAQTAMTDGARHGGVANGPGRPQDLGSHGRADPCTHAQSSNGMGPARMPDRRAWRLLVPLA